MRAFNVGTYGVVFNNVWSCIGFGVHDTFNNAYVFGVLNPIVYYGLPSSSCNSDSISIIKCRVGGGGVISIEQDKNLVEVVDFGVGIKFMELY